MRKYILTLGIAAAVAFGLSACSAIDLTKSGNQPAAAPPSPSAPAGPGIKAVDTANLGRIVTDEKGWTLYLFSKDKNKPAKSNCDADCLKKWPAVPYVEGLKIDGVDPKLVGKLQRSDGTWQLTINGWPTYKFTGDKAVGDTKGQGVGGVWYALTPEGKKAQAVAGDGNGGGY
jgi:predicted lipoprotein with Yx(FWY)xxD motif